MDFRVQSSGLKAADAAICAVPCKLHAIQLISDGTNAASVVVYDNASAASGTAVLKSAIGATTVPETTVALNSPVVCHNGIYADVTGTGANYIVHFSIGD